jgi:uncharacterized protein (DUF885 family)
VVVSQDLFALCSDLVDETAAASPVLATEVGIAGYDHLWDDFSTTGAEAFRDLLQDQLARLEAVDPGGDPVAELAREVAAASISDQLARYRTDEHLRDLNSIASTLQHIRETFDHMPKQSREGWDAVAARLERLGTAVAGYQSRLEDGRRRGLAVSRRQALEGVRQARHNAGEASSLLSLTAELASSGIGDGALAERVDAGTAVGRQAFSDLADYLERVYLPAAGDEDAVGEERYSESVARFLGETIDLGSTYEWGWSEVGRLLERMAEVAGQIQPGASLPEVLHILQTDPARAAASPEEFNRLMSERQQVALRDLDGTHFQVPAQVRRVDTKLAPPGGSLGAYYVGPSEDFSRPGTVWFAIGDAKVIPLFDQVSTAYHEGFPGHHLQTGIQMAGADRLSRYQKMLVWYPGSGEGWALYAEDLMEELGYLDEPDYVMGKLASEMLRACRVVIDIGSHLRLPIPRGQPFHPGEYWTFDTGVEMLEDYSAQDHPVAVSEMTRYLGWPGQAISYKVGQQEIRDLRVAAEKRGGPAFDRKVFHSRLLELGSVGLDLLKRCMTEL